MMGNDQKQQQAWDSGTGPQGLRGRDTAVQSWTVFQIPVPARVQHAFLTQPLDSVVASKQEFTRKYVMWSLA